MKKLITMLTACSLALAVSAFAQDDQPQKKKERKKERQAAPQQQQGQAAPNAPAQPQRQMAHPQTPRRAREMQKANQEAPAAREKANDDATPDANAQPQAPDRKGRHARENAANREPAADAANKDKAKPEQKDNANQGQATETAPANQPAASPANMNANTRPNGPKKKPTAANIKQNVQAAKKPANAQAIKQRNANFKAEKRADVPTVTFVQNRRIVGAERWAGPQYVTFREYRPLRHDRGWWTNHYNNIILIGGGYYYFNSGYWYPAWGYEPTAEYYAYDGPIYAGHAAEPPDKVIADVQASLQEMGYYKGEVDGLLGPLTREALNGYQEDNGLYVTGAIDEPTLQALDMT